MKHVLLLFPFIFIYLLADKVEITSDSMNAQNVKKQVEFLGNVKIKQTENWLHGDKVIVYFDENNETQKYEAIGHVSFEFHKDKSFYLGSANKVTFFPQGSKYLLEGKANIDDKINKRQLNGDSIDFDMITGKANVKGNKKKPVKFIFDMGN